MHFKLSFLLTLALVGVAHAEPAVGVWRTEPDQKGIVAHVNVFECGPALCGKIVRTFDSNGQEIAAASLGERVIRDARLTTQGVYKGRAWVPAHKREYRAKMALNGNTLNVRGCLGPVCMSQNWARVQ